MLILGPKMSYLRGVKKEEKFKTFALNHFLNSVIWHNFRKTLAKDLEKSSYIIILGPKMPYLPFSGHDKNFPKIIKELL